MKSKKRQEYTKEDLNWHESESRNYGMGDLDAHPEVKELPENIKDYDKIYLGFPIWWYLVPKVVLSFP